MDDLWQKLYHSALEQSRREKLLQTLYQQTVLQHQNPNESMGYILAHELAKNALIDPASLAVRLTEVLQSPAMTENLLSDLNATYDRDPACTDYLQAWIFFKGFHALQCHRVAHVLWQQGEHALAYYLQNQCSHQYGVDIHPAAYFAKNIVLDHATGLVVGETAVIGNDVSIMQGVTLGGTGKDSGDRHPKVGDGVLISAGAIVLGNIHIGECARVGAGSVVLRDVAPNTTVAGVPARVVSSQVAEKPGIEMDHNIDK